MRALPRPALRFIVLVVVYTLLGVAITGFHPELGGVFIAEIVLLLAMYCSRGFVVAVKYGYMPVCDYNVIKYGEEKAATAVQRRHQLLTGWIVPEEAVLNLELTDAAARHRIDLAAHSIRIPK